MKALPSLAAVAVPLASWAFWYQLVLARAARRTARWGPPGLVASFTSFTRWFARSVGRCSFETSEGGPPKRQVIMGVHPHGTYMISAAFFCGKIFCDPTNTPGWFVCVQSLLFRIPGVSECLLLVNGRSADLDVMGSILDGGHSIGIQPGGLHEQVRTDPDVEAAYFPSNLGFIRLAIERGVPLVPVYVFGENQLYGQSQATRAANGFLKRRLGVGSLFVIGRFGLPWPLFKPTALYMHYGDIVEVGPPEPNPSEGRVREVFSKYVTELRRVFAANADARLPPANAKNGLKVVWRGHPSGVPHSKL